MNCILFWIKFLLTEIISMYSSTSVSSDEDTFDRHPNASAKGGFNMSSGPAE